MTLERIEVQGPKFLIFSGLIGTGKSTVSREMIHLNPHAVLIEKDPINRALLHEPAAWPTGLQSAQTFLGEMYEHTPTGDYYERNVRIPSYLVMAALARTYLELGKVVILDTIPVYMIRDGTIKRLMEEFADYPSYLIHFVADEDECYRRLVERAANDPYKRTHDGEKIVSREVFHHFATEIQPMYPPEVDLYPHLTVDTTNLTPTECALRCLRYIT